MKNVHALNASKGHVALDRAASALRRLPLKTLAGALPGLYALLLGLRQLSLARPTELEPDAVTFLQLAHDMTPSTVFNGWREPLWPVLLALPTKLLGIHPTMIRALSVAGFVLMIVAFQRLVTRLYGRTWGIVAALAMAASPWLVHESARGLREEASTGLVLLFVAGVIAGTSGRRLVLLSAAAGVAALLRWDTVMLTVPTLVIAVIIHRPKIRHALQAGSIFIILVAPNLIAAKVNYGNPLYFSSTLTPMFFRNAEFAGKPGFITQEQFSQNAYGGERITWFEYFTQVLTPAETARRTASGLTTIPLTATNCSISNPPCSRLDGQWPTLALASSLSTLLPWLLVVAGVTGSALLIRRQGAWPLPLILGLSVGPFAPIAKLGVFDPRLIITTLPFIVIGALECLRVALRRRARHGRSAPVTRSEVETQGSDSHRDRILDAALPAG